MINCPHCDESIADEVKAEIEKNYTANDEVEDVSGLKTALEKTREEKKELKAKKAKLEDELATAKVLIEDATLKLRDADPQLRTELNAAKEQLATMVSKSEFDSLKTQLDESTATTTQLRDEATQGRIATAVAKAGGNLAMLSPMIKSEMLKNPELDLGEHLATLKTDSEFAGAFKASEHSGGGSDPGKGNDVTFGRSLSATASLRRSTMTDRQKVDHQKQYGLDSLLSLPE